MPNIREHPSLPLTDLDTLWFQVAGTLCNLQCTHCFISCSPTNDTHPLLPTETWRNQLQEAKRYGVKEYYFTGGEPFLHPDLLEMVEGTLVHGPLTVLTNGILITERRAARLAEISRNSRYSLDFRISLDGLNPEENNEIRGEGTFEKIMRGVFRLVDVGITPIITVTEVREGMGSAKGREQFIQMLKDRGIAQPRLKFLTPFQIGAEADRTCGYSPEQYVYEGDLIPGEEEELQCASSRMITADGVYPCPILINHGDAKMGETLQEGERDVRLQWSACYTCHVSGVSCRN
jgi:MoaA/NifB/PqqE/SkfB family radical SAM enzyme